MDKNAVRQFARFIGTKIESTSSQGWAQCKCPLAPWTHDSGKDSNPSAAIHIKPGGVSVFTCFTCENHDLSGLLMRLRELGAKGSKYNYREAMRLLSAEEEESLVPAIKDYDADDLEDDGNNDATYPESFLTPFPRAVRIPQAMTYLRGRGVHVQTVDELDIRWDPTKRTVCFPIRDAYGVLCGFRGRRIAPKEGQPPYHIYKTEEGVNGHYNRRVWLGEHHVDWERPVVMVESVFDYAAVFPVYGNVVAPLTVGMSEKKVRRMAAATDIVTLFDQGAGGSKARGLIDKYLPKNNRVHLIPAGPPASWVHGDEATDPGEMRRQDLMKLLQDHVPIEA